MSARFPRSRNEWPHLERHRDEHTSVARKSCDPLVKNYIQAEVAPAVHFALYLGWSQPSVAVLLEQLGRSKYLRGSSSDSDSGISLQCSATGDLNAVVLETLAERALVSWGNLKLSGVHVNFQSRQLEGARAFVGCGALDLWRVIRSYRGSGPKN